MVDFYFILLQKSRTESASKKKLTATKSIKPESSGTRSARKSASKKVSNKQKVCAECSFGSCIACSVWSLLYPLMLSPNPHASQILEVIKIGNEDHSKSEIFFLFGGNNNCLRRGKGRAVF